MQWSWRIGEFRGIGVYMHATFLILIGFVVLKVRGHPGRGEEFRCSRQRAPEVSCHIGNTLSLILDATTQVGCCLRSRMAKLTMLTTALAESRGDRGGRRVKALGRARPLAATSPGVSHD